ncbi:MAG: methionine biosynthesis protein MetW [Cellvibrionales bacterium]|nr:methionine biosynthesis protein MetW [Cellvibrionales bacterium]
MRIDHRIIAPWVAPGSRVLDLGCGDGALLAHLRETRNASGYGLENSAEAIRGCVERGINVIEKSLERELDDFGDNSFDTVLMTFALQVMKHPDIMLAEMLRVGRECIITFPNFGHLPVRLALLFRGRMPVTRRLTYQWYDTPNIHFCTVADFEALCRAKGYRIRNRAMLSRGFSAPLKDLWPNLFAETAVYHLSN